MQATGDSGDDRGSDSKDDSSRPSTPGKPTDWKLENSSLWWLSLDFFQNPANILLISSVPFCAGAYYGYSRPGNNLEEWVSDLPPENRDSTKATNSAGNRITRKAIEKETEIMATRQLGAQLAARALGVATLGIVGTFGVVAGAGFYLSGCRSVAEAMDRTRRWASMQAQSFDDFIGFEDRESMTHPDVLATKGMTEEQEINYVYDKLMREVEIDKERSNDQG